MMTERRLKRLLGKESQLLVSSLSRSKRWEPPQRDGNPRGLVGMLGQSRRVSLGLGTSRGGLLQYDVVWLALNQAGLSEGGEGLSSPLSSAPTLASAAARRYLFAGKEKDSHAITNRSDANHRPHWRGRIVLRRNFPTGVLSRVRRSDRWAPRKLVELFFPGERLYPPKEVCDVAVLDQRAVRTVPDDAFWRFMRHVRTL